MYVSVENFPDIIFLHYFLVRHDSGRLVVNLYMRDRGLQQFHYIFCVVGTIKIRFMFISMVEMRTHRYETNGRDKKKKIEIFNLTSVSVAYRYFVFCKNCTFLIAQRISCGIENHLLSTVFLSVMLA